MTVSIASPLLADTRSSVADWLEITTVLSSRGRSTEAAILGVFDLAEDAAAAESVVDEETGEPLDDAILEEPRQEFISTIFEELSYRKGCLGDSYPFTVDVARGTLDRMDGDAMTHAGQLVYLFCLLASMIRRRSMQPVERFADVERDIANNFQICACLAAGGYLVGEVASFGFPRASGDSFLPALQSVYKRFGAGQVRVLTEVPPGLPDSLKDGGIDVIAWRDLPDAMPGKIYLLGQCASGMNWRNKSALEYIEQLHGAWFTAQPARHSIPAMFIPFPFHDEIEGQPGRPFLELVRNRYWYEEPRFGIIFDRLRIAHFAQACVELSAEAQEKVDGAARLGDIRHWVETTISLSAGHGEAA
jgi:hypothetical protein